MGKRYLVEFQEESNETEYWFYERYSDGWIKQGGILNNNMSFDTPITFPLEFRDTKYNPNAIAVAEQSLNHPSYDRTAIQQMTTTGMTVSGGNRPITSWICEGWAKI